MKLASKSFLLLKFLLCLVFFLLSELFAFDGHHLLWLANGTDPVTREAWLPRAYRTIEMAFVWFGLFVFCCVWVLHHHEHAWQDMSPPVRKKAIAATLLIWLSITVLWLLLNYSFSGGRLQPKGWLWESRSEWEGLYYFHFLIIDLVFFWLVRFLVLKTFKSRTPPKTT
jgi:hypothetical protein